MQRFITDERIGIQYELIGDYYYPCLTIEELPTLTKYGRMCNGSGGKVHKDVVECSKLRAINWNF